VADVIKEGLDVHIDYPLKFVTLL